MANQDALVVFPRDEGVHPGQAHEWWYFCAHVTDVDGHKYGIMVCFFNNGKLYLGLTDEHQGEHYVKVTKGDFRAARGKLEVSIDGSWWREEGNRRYALFAECDQLKFDLGMEATKPPLLVGGRGQVPIGRGGNSHYYSQTRLQVSGTLTMHGKECVISGTGWIDRQWGSWDFDGLSGWEWFCIQLENGTDILLCEVMDPHFGTPLTPMLEIMDANGCQETLTSYQLDRIDTWKHPESGEEFSHGWRVRIPAKDVDLEIKPTVAAQLLHKGLWEGSCEVHGRSGGKEVRGRAYAELLRQPRPNVILRTAEYVASLTRLPEWISKVQVVFTAALVLLLFDPTEAGFAWPLVALAVYMAFIGCYGYSLNSYADQHQDREAGKPEKLGLLPDRHVRLAIFFFGVGSLAIPFLLRDIWVAIVGVVTFILATAYSARPIRLKERGILGIVTAAVVQRPMPFLLFALLVGSMTPLTWYLLGHLTILGLMGITTHQLTDFVHDRKARVDTWATTVGFSHTRIVAGVLVALSVANLVTPVPLFGIRDGLAIAAVTAVMSATPFLQSFRDMMQREPAT